MKRFGAEAEDAGAVEHYQDAALYDRTYKHRRTDAAFYRMLADERLGFGEPSPVLELACGSGRLTVPLLRAGHAVVGFDRSPVMLAEAQKRVARLPRVRRQKALFFRADMRVFAITKPVSLIIAGFHSLQHLIEDDDLLTCLQHVRRSLRPDGWFAFDILPPHPAWLGTTGEVRFNRRLMRHPTGPHRIRYGESHLYDERRKALHVQLVYQPVDDDQHDIGQPRIVKLCHRQFWPGDLEHLLDRAGLKIIARYSDFDPEAAETAESLPAQTFEHVFVAKPKTDSEIDPKINPSPSKLFVE